MARAGARLTGTIGGYGVRVLHPPISVMMVGCMRFDFSPTPLVGQSDNHGNLAGTFDGWSRVGIVPYLPIADCYASNIALSLTPHK